jgi:hypothetical protein
VLRERNGTLVCVPLDSDNGDVFDARRRYVTRDPAGRVESETEETEEATSDDSAFNDAQMDAERQRELAYQDYIRDVSSRWRSWK